MYSGTHYITSIDIRDTVIWSNKYKLLNDTVLDLGRIKMFLRVNSHTRSMKLLSPMATHNSNRVEEKKIINNEHIYSKKLPIISSITIIKMIVFMYKTLLI